MMSVEILFGTALIVGLIYLYLRQVQSKKPPLPPVSVPRDIQAVPRHPQPDGDPFMAEVELDRARTDAAIESERRRYEQELETRYSDDLMLKKELSEFAQKNRLDVALIDLWEAIKHYPAWSERDDFEELNKLHLFDLNEYEDKDTKLVEFTLDGARFKVGFRSWYGAEGDGYADFSFFEDGEEVFAIKCSGNYDGDFMHYSCFDVSAFRKRGTWATALLKCHQLIQIESERRSTEYKYYRADEIKSRFQR